MLVRPCTPHADVPTIELSCRASDSPPPPVPNSPPPAQPSGKPFPCEYAYFGNGTGGACETTTQDNPEACCNACNMNAATVSGCGDNPVCVGFGYDGQDSYPCFLYFDSAQ